MNKEYNCTIVISQKSDKRKVDDFHFDDYRVATAISNIMHTVNYVRSLDNPTLLQVIDGKDNSGLFTYSGNAETISQMLDALLEIIARDDPAIIDRLLMARLKKK